MPFFPRRLSSIVGQNGSIEDQQKIEIKAMNKLNRCSNTKSFSRHKFQKFYFKKSLRCKIFKIRKESSLHLNTQIYRPLIQFSRFEFLKFCEFWYLPVIPDLTNLNVHFQRNRLRLQSLPYLKFFFNIDLFQKINSIQKIINLENEYFQLIIQKLLLTSLKTFQYSERKKSFRSSIQKALIILKYRTQLVNSKISKSKHASFIVNIVQNLRTLQSTNAMRSPMEFKSAMFKIYINRVQLREVKSMASQSDEKRGDIILENIEKNIQIYCPNFGFISVYPAEYQRFYYKLIKSCFQATHSNFKAHPIVMRQIIHPKTCIARECLPDAHRLPQLAHGIDRDTRLGQVYNIELFLWIHKYFRIQFKQKQSLFRTTGLKIKRDLDKKKFNKKLLQKTTGSEIHFIQWNMLGLKPIRSHDLSTLLYSVRYNFLYFPKILQYRILHNFYNFIQKKISFNEISCIFQRITIFLNSKSSKKK